MPLFAPLAPWREDESASLAKIAKIATTSPLNSVQFFFASLAPWREVIRFLLLIQHSPFRIPHFRQIPHSPFRTPHSKDSAFPIPHSAFERFRIRHSAFHIQVVPSYFRTCVMSSFASFACLCVSARRQASLRENKARSLAKLAKHTFLCSSLRPLRLRVRTSPGLSPRSPRQAP
jgi:hypothetical protein